MDSTNTITYDENAFADPVGLDAIERVCPSCMQSKPQAAFASNATVKCIACADRGRAKTKRIRTLKDALAQLASRQIVAAARGDRIDAPRISQVCGKMIELFGGVDGFCHKWHEHIMVACDNNPGGKNALDQLRSIAKLIKDSTSSVDSANAIASLTDDELQGEIDVAITRIVTEQRLSLSEDIDTDDMDDLDEESLDDLD